MQNTKHATLSSWLLWAPLRFAVISLGLMLGTTLLYNAIATRIYTASPIPQTPIVILLTLSIAFAATLLIRRLPCEKMDRNNFIRIHNAQTFILSITLIVSSIILFMNPDKFMLQLLWLETHASLSFLILAIIAAIFYMYLLGLLISNIYAKYLRTRDMDIPAWKVICSMPFGFSMLWSAGYLMNTKPVTKKSKSDNWYSRITNWVLAKQSNTILSFICITLLSGFFFGFRSILLTFALALVYGIWALQVGAKTLSKDISHRYTNTAIIINIILLVLIIGFNTMVPSPQEVQVVISDISQINETIQ